MYGSVIFELFSILISVIEMPMQSDNNNIPIFVIHSI